LVVVKGFFEWQVQADGKTKVPFFIHVNDQEVFAFAGLFCVSCFKSCEDLQYRWRGNLARSRKGRGIS